MNTTKKVLIAVLVISIIGTAQASAGLLDWTTDNDATAVTSRAAAYISEVFTSSNTVVNSAKAVTTIRDSAVAERGVIPEKNAAQKSRLKINYVVSASAYSSTPDQTDNTPFITARGTYVRDGIIAANFLPFGTIVKIPNMYGSKIFVVEDRMNKRYSKGHIDIWFPDRESALEFGRRTVVIEVLPS